MKTLSISLLSVFFLLASCNDGKVGNYKKEPLPDDLIWEVIADDSNPKVDRNSVTVRINKKLTIGQIATLAEKIFQIKPERKRFYISYLLPGMEPGAGAWAISHFDPELKIEILGSSTVQDEARKIVELPSEAVQIGKWINVSDGDLLVFYKIGNKFFVKFIFKDGTSMDEEVVKTKENGLDRFNYKDGSMFGEYFLINKSGVLELYSADGRMFSKANPVD